MKNRVKQTGWAVSFLGVLLGALVAQAAGSDVISGKVDLSAGLENKISPTAALYVIARPNGITAGPPTAVKRIAGPFKFPVSFELSAKDAMMPDTPFEGEFTLIARITQKGSAIPTTGDLQSSKPVNNVKPGSKAITLKIDEVRK